MAHSSVIRSHHPHLSIPKYYTCTVIYNAFVAYDLGQNYLSLKQKNSLEILQFAFKQWEIRKCEYFHYSIFYLSANDKENSCAFGFEFTCVISVFNQHFTAF